MLSTILMGSTYVLLGTYYCYCTTHRLQKKRLKLSTKNSIYRVSVLSLTFYISYLCFELFKLNTVHNSDPKLIQTLFSLTSVLTFTTLTLGLSMLFEKQIKVLCPSAKKNRLSKNGD